MLIERNDDFKRHCKDAVIQPAVNKTHFENPEDLFSWMGVMQAQDYNMSKWAVGARMKNLTVTEVEKVLNDGKIICTHVLRPTWHLVSPKDIQWMLDLSASQIRVSMRSTNKELELSESVFKKSRSVLEKSLVGGNHLTRQEIALELNKSKIKTGNNRLSYILLDAELNGVVCSGKLKGRKQTYGLLEERVPKRTTLKKEEALRVLAEKYFQSHGPATLKDFTWWSGLLVKDSKFALKAIENRLFSEVVGSEVYWFSEKLKPTKIILNDALLLPAFDEYLISYKDRTASITQDRHRVGISINGIFYPMILVNGQALGTWEKTETEEGLMIKLNYFQKVPKVSKKLIEKPARKLCEFLEKKIVDY